MQKLTDEQNIAMALVLSRYGAVLETADLSTISLEMLEQLFILHCDVTTTSDPRTALLSSVCCAIQHYDDAELALGENQDIYSEIFEPASGSLIKLLALERTLQALDLLQCTALLERIEEVAILAEGILGYGHALDQVFERMKRRIF